MASIITHLLTLYFHSISLFMHEFQTLVRHCRTRLQHCQANFTPTCLSYLLSIFNNWEILESQCHTKVHKNDPISSGSPSWHPEFLINACKTFQVQFPIFSHHSKFIHLTLHPGFLDGKLETKPFLNKPFSPISGDLISLSAQSSLIQGL